MNKTFGTCAVFTLLAAFLAFEGLCIDAACAAGWDPSTPGPITGWTAPVCDKEGVVIQTFLWYSNVRGSFDNDSKRFSIPQGDTLTQYQLQLFSQYGVMDQLEIDGQIGYIKNNIEHGGLSADGAGLSDSMVFARYCFMEERSGMPHLTALAQLKIPTGKYQNSDANTLGADITGTGSWDHGYGLTATKKLKPFIVHGDIIYTFPCAVTVDNLDTQYGNYLNYDISIEYVLSRDFDFLGEINGFYQDHTIADGSKVADSTVNSLIISPGLGWSRGSFQTLVSYQRTVRGKNADEFDSVVLTMIWAF